MAIVAGYVAGQRYGLLGPQMAATVIRELTGIECLVVAVCREDDPDGVRAAMVDYFGSQRPLVGFSSLAGRPELFALAGRIRAEGGVTVLAGPQAGVDFIGERGRSPQSHYFPGVAGHFSLAFQGPAEGFVPFLDSGRWRRAPGFLYRTAAGRTVRNRPGTWDGHHLARVDWHTLFCCHGSHLTPVPVASAQVLEGIGCPHAAGPRRLSIDYPAGLTASVRPSVAMGVRGCSFCDVAADKGFCGKMGRETVLAQIACLPTDGQGRKVPFELINEHPLGGLAGLIADCRARGLELSRIDLTLRADWLVQGEGALRRGLARAKESGLRVLIASVGFESFHDPILRNLNKGVDRATNLAAVRVLRRVKADYPDTFGYMRQEGANHGLIHPTPWDTPASEDEMRRTAATYNLPADILPDHSTPLIVHHASFLGDWIRRIEAAEQIRYPRQGPIIAWWEEPMAAGDDPM